MLGINDQNSSCLEAISEWFLMVLTNEIARGPKCGDGESWSTSSSLDALCLQHFEYRSNCSCAIFCIQKLVVYRGSLSDKEANDFGSLHGPC